MNCRLLMTVVFLAAAVPVAAADCEVLTEGLPTDVAGFLADFYAASDTAIQVGFPAAEDLRGAVMELEASIWEMSDEELMELCYEFERFPSLSEAPRLLNEAMLVTAELNGASQCNEVAYWVLFFISLPVDFFEIAGTAACNIADCVKSELVSKIVCTVLCIVEGVLKLAATLVHFGLDVVEGLCLDDHMEDLDWIDVQMTSGREHSQASREVLLEHLDAILSSRASETSVAGVTAMVAGLDDTVGATIERPFAGEIDGLLIGLSEQAADRRKFQTLSLQLEIEKHLRSHTDPIATFQLPESVGGRLELVREVVASTITVNLEAGNNVHDALQYFNLADHYLNTNRYKRAFSNYRLAYLEAVREVPY